MNKKEFLNSKICKSYKDVKFSRWLAYWRFKTEKTVFVYGDFDFLHYGNQLFLTHAAEYGSVLIVGVLNSQKKYIHDINQRAFNVAAHHYVDYVVYADENDILDLFEFIKPDVFVYTGQQEIPKQLLNFCEKNNILTKKFQCPSGFSNVEFNEKLKNFLN